MLVFESNWRKTSRSKEENQQQSKPTYGVDARTWTRPQWVGGGCSQHCATFARAQNNFSTVAGHDDRPKKFFPYQVSFSDRLKWGAKRELILVSFSISGRDFILWSFWPVKTPFLPDIVRWPVVILGPVCSTKSITIKTMLIMSYFFVTDCLPEVHLASVLHPHPVRGRR